MAKNLQPELKTEKNRLTPVLLLVLGIVLLWFSLVSSWLTRTIFNQQVFVAAVSSALQSDQSRQVISETVVNRVLADYPIIRRAVGSTLTNTVSGILASAQFQPVYNRAAQQVFIQMTTANPKPVEIDFQNAFTFVTPILERLNPKLATRVENLPEKIVIINKGQIPSIAPFGSFLSFFGPLAGVAGVVLLGFLLWKAGGREERLKFLIWGGLIFAGVAFVLNLMVPSAEIWMMSKISSEAVATIISQVFENLVASFVVLTQTSLVLGLVMAAVSFGLLKFWQRKNS